MGLILLSSRPTISADQHVGRSFILHIKPCSFRIDRYNNGDPAISEESLTLCRRVATFDY
jgi:hypothetical protein